MITAHRKPVRRVSPRLPLPSSVYVYNIFGRNLQSDRLRSKQWFYHRPEPAVELLHEIRLELTVSREVVEECSTAHASAEKKERVLFSHSVSMGLTQPVWHHLNESIDLNDFSVEEYESMTLRFYLLNGTPQWKKLCSSTRANGPITGSELLWQQVFVHPSKLARLGRLPEPHREKLPLNFIVVEYSDKSLRILPSHHQTVSEAGSDDLVLASNNTRILFPAKSHNSNDRQSDDDFGRFEDTVFSTLDQVTPVTPEDTNDSSISINESTSAIRKTGTEGVNDSSSPRQQELLEQMRRQYLESHIYAQERAVQHNIQLLQSRQHRALIMKEEIAKRRNQISQIMCEAKKERKRGQEISLGLQSQKVRLLRDLQSLFPIAPVVSPGGEQGFSICGLELPSGTSSDLLFGVSEDELSAALGYLCHLVHMLSKYLAIQLRYRLLCHNSSSGIQDEQAILYPLFLHSRTAAERCQFEHGLRLLHRNVESILRHQNIAASPSLHILGKVKRIYEHVADGY